MMQLLNQLQYLRLLDETGREMPRPLSGVDEVLDVATDIWSSLGLESRPLGPDDVAGYQHGEHSLFHVKAFSPDSGKDDTYVILVQNAADAFTGYLLIDLAAEYASPTLDCPSFDFDGPVTAKQLEEFIPCISADDNNPYLVLSLRDGTYMQAYLGEGGFDLEYQLVNVSSHYRAPESCSAKQVLSAMLSYGFGKYEWLSFHEWERMVLD